MSVNRESPGSIKLQTTVLLFNGERAMTAFERLTGSILIAVSVEMIPKRIKILISHL